jgi:hypothetical protein
MRGQLSFRGSSEDTAEIPISVASRTVRNIMSKYHRSYVLRNHIVPILRKTYIC